jgi:hypothetical protein
MLMLPRNPLVALIVLALLYPSPARAQAVPVFAAGSLVRIHAPGLTPGRIEATVEAYTHEGLFVREAASGAVYRIPDRRNIHYLAHYRGVDRRYTARRYAMGAGFLGGALGAVGGPLIAVARKDDDGMIRTAILASGAGVALGGLVGALLGGRVSTESWKVYRLPAMRPYQPPPAGESPEPQIPHS